MTKLKLSYACCDNDRIRPISMGKVKAKGIDLNCIYMEPEELFWRIIKYEEYDVSEFSLAAYMILMGRNDSRFIGIPVFPSRMFRHSSVFINKNSGIQKAEDLKGKRVGLPDYSYTSTVWIRGYLEHDHGVSSKDIRWFFGGVNEPGFKEQISLDVPNDLHLEYIGNEKTLSDMLERGEIDAFIGTRAPQCHSNKSNAVSHLWLKHVEREKEYFKRTGIFPIMHLTVIRKNIYESYPWVAHSLYQALSEAKSLCQKEMYTYSSLKNMIPWFNASYEETIEIMGEDYWPYGVENNRNVLETFNQYCVEQCLLKKPIEVDKMFARNVY